MLLLAVEVKEAAELSVDQLQVLLLWFCWSWVLELVASDLVEHSLFCLVVLFGYLMWWLRFGLRYLLNLLLLLFQLFLFYFNHFIDLLPLCLFHLLFLRYFFLIWLLTPLLGVLAIIVHGKHIVVFNAVLEQIDSSLPAELPLILLLTLLHEGFNIGSQALPQRIVQLRIALIFLEAEDVVYKLQASFVVISRDEGRDGYGAVEVKVEFLVNEACVVIEESIEFRDVVGSMRAVFCHSFPYIFIYNPPQTQKQKILKPLFLLL